MERHKTIVLNIELDVSGQNGGVFYLKAISPNTCSYIRGKKFLQPLTLLCTQNPDNDRYKNHACPAYYIRRKSETGCNKKQRTSRPIQDAALQLAEACCSRIEVEILFFVL